MKAHITWAYDTTQGGPAPPPPQEADIEIPRYTDETLGNIQVHFYPDHRIKVIVSPYGIESPCGPLSEAEKAPWSTDRGLIEYYTTGNGKDKPCAALRNKGAAQ
jgi:hypothetical protein